MQLGRWSVSGSCVTCGNRPSGFCPRKIGSSLWSLARQKCGRKYFLQRGAFTEADEFLKFGVFVEAIEIGVPGRPIQVAVSGRNGLFERLERLRLSREDT